MSSTYMDDLATPTTDESPRDPMDALAAREMVCAARRHGLEVAPTAATP